MKSQVTNLEELLETNRTPGSRDIDPNRIRKAIVTGGDSGIGRYTAMALAEDGCDVAITWAHHEDDAKLTAKAIESFGRKAYIEKMDLNDPQAGVTSIDNMVEALGGLDIFVNNAGKMTKKVFPELELEDIQSQFAINTFGATLAIQRASQHMLGISDGILPKQVAQILQQARKVIAGEIASPRKTPGRIIVVTSVHEHIASPADTIYTMAKHALGGLIKSAAFSLAGTNVTINGVRPGEIATPMNENHPEDCLDAKRKFIPGRRPGHPTEIASMIRYLASDDSTYVNGMSYDVDGGMTISTPMAMEGYQKLA